MADQTPEYNFPFMQGGGEAGSQIRSYSWERTPLGNPITWPACIKLAVSICLHSSFPMCIYWGPEYRLIYNDAYGLIAGDKHPGIMGKPRSEVWPEGWETIKPVFDGIIENGGSVRNEHSRFVLRRNGFDEECYFDYTLTAICDETGIVQGVLNTVSETTAQVVTTRRNLLFQKLGLQLHDFRSQIQAYGHAITLLSSYPDDIPFAMLYRYEVETGFSLIQSIGVPDGIQVNPCWPLHDVLDDGFMRIVECDLDVLTSTDVSAETTANKIRATMIPLRQADNSISGIFIAGMNKLIRPDDQYKEFLLAIASQLSVAINNGTSFETEKKHQDQLQYSQDQLQFAIDATGLGTWDLNPMTNVFSGNDRLKSWFGLPPDGEISLDLALDVIAEADRPGVALAIQEAMNCSSGGDYEIEYTIINPKNPEPRIVWAKGKSLFNEDQEVTRFSGTLQDITETRKTRDALERAYEQARLSKEAAQLGTFDMDMVTGILHWDARCRLLFGISHNRKITYEVDFLNGLHPEDKDMVLAEVDKAFVKSESNGDFDVEYRTLGSEDKMLRWVRAKGKVLFNEADEPLRFIGSILEITNQKENEIRKNDFIGMVSHELKTPLTSLKAYVQVLNTRARKEGNSFSVNSLNKVELQINKMSSLINGFLNLSRLESGKIHLHKTDFNIDDLVREIIDETMMVVSSHQIFLLACSSIEVNADRDKIGQVITNLVSNAVKYSPRGQVVELACEHIGEHVQVSVRDEGMGIRQQDKDRLFQRFYRVESAHTESIAGFGIGLYLSAEIVQHHGGKIWMESEKGVGSKFYFSLPAKRET